MILIYGGVLNAIEKTLWDLVEGQKRNMAQLARIEAVIEWR